MTSIKYLKAHVKTKHENEQHYCNSCDYMPNTSSALKSHTTKIHEIGQTLSLPCDQCSFIAKPASDMRKHVEDHNPIAFQCSQCGFKTKNINYQTKYILIQIDAI